MKKHMLGWNVVVTVRDFKRACEVLSAFGRVEKTDFYNTLVMKVEDVPRMLETLRSRYLQDPEHLNFLSRLIPVDRTFVFNSADEFENRAYRLSRAWLDRLKSKSFHVRIHRRGLREEIRSPDVEQFLDDMLLEDLRMADAKGHITFEDPDAIIDVETIRNRAGLSFCTREQMERYPFMRLN